MAKYIVTHGIRIAKDFTPETIGRLTTIGPRFMLSKGDGGWSVSMQVCQCDCGVYFVVHTNHFITQHTKSCGCLRPTYCRSVYTRHGKTGTSEFRIWCQIRNRCNNTRHHAYADYGGRGVKLCEQWSSTGIGFQNFYDYMGPRPSPKHSVDRHPDPNGNYEPGNVRWATSEEQARNRRSNHNITFSGKTQCLTAWAEEVGIHRATILHRLQSGWTVEKALTAPVKVKK